MSEESDDFRGYCCPVCGNPMKTSFDMSYCETCDDWWMNHDLEDTGYD